MAVRNVDMREKTGAKNCRYLAKKLKMDCAGHGARKEQDRWERDE